MKTHLREEPETLAERHMRAWAYATETSSGPRCFGEGERKLGPVLTFSREHGAGGGEIAEMVGSRLDWEVFDRCLLDRIAQRYHLSRPMLELVDETKSNWIHDVLGTWMDTNVIPHEKYLTHLRQIVLNAARCGPAIFVGRGVQFLLPRPSVVAIRIIAAEGFRAARVAQQRGIPERKARQVIREVDRGRAEFVARYFHRNINDPHLYDLVINVENHGPAAAAAAICKMCSDW